MAPSSIPEDQASCPKLRNSCDECTANKVGCTKEKPACARCAKRGLTCAYSATKRRGRTARHKQQSARSSAELDLSWPNQSPTSTQSAFSLPTSSAVSQGTDLSLAWPDLSHRSTRPISPSASDRFAGFLSGSDTSSALSPTASSSDLDSLLASVAPLSSCNPYDWDASAFPSSSGSYDLDDLVKFDGIPVNDSSAFSNALSEPLSQPVRNGGTGGGSVNIFPESNGNDHWPEPDFFAAFSNEFKLGDIPIHQQVATTGTEDRQQGVYEKFDSTCRCLAKALELLAQLHDDAPNQDSPEATQDYDSLQWLKFEQLFVENEQTIESVGAILKCACSANGCLLNVLSLIVFTILARYKIAASALPTREGPYGAIEFVRRGQACLRAVPVRHANPPAVIDYLDTDGEDSQRMVAQCVLPRLLEVQRVVRALSQRLHDVRPVSQEGVMAEALSSSAKGNSSVSTTTDTPFSTPLSAKMARTLEEEVRRYLVEVSRATVEALRHF